MGSLFKDKIHFNSEKRLDNEETRKIKITINPFYYYNKSIYPVQVFIQYRCLSFKILLYNTIITVLSFLQYGLKTPKSTFRCSTEPYIWRTPGCVSKLWTLFDNRHFPFFSLVLHLFICKLLYGYLWYLLLDWNHKFLWSNWNL